MRTGSSLISRGEGMLDFGSRVASVHFRKMLGGQVIESSVTGASANIGNYVFNDEGYEVSAGGVLRASAAGFGIGALTPVAGRGLGAGTNQLISRAPGYLNNKVTQFTTDFASGRTVDYGAGYVNYYAADEHNISAEEAKKEGTRALIGGGALDLGFRLGK